MPRGMVNIGMNRNSIASTTQAAALEACIHMRKGMKWVARDAGSSVDAVYWTKIGCLDISDVNVRRRILVQMEGKRRALGFN